MCSCGCQTKEDQKAPTTPQEEKKSYICYKCNTFKDATTSEPAPECCGKRMDEVD